MPCKHTGSHLSVHAGVLSLACCVLVALPATVVVAIAAAPACSGATSLSFSVAWDRVPESDRYMVEIAKCDGCRPFAFQTASPTRGAAREAVELLDLVPNKKYFLSIRSHPSDAPSLVWGWRPATKDLSLACSTLPAPARAPQSLRRVGGRGHVDSIEIEWSTSSKQEQEQDQDGPYEVGLRQVGAVAMGRVGRSPALMRWEPAQQQHRHRLRNLPSGAAFDVAVRMKGGPTSDALRLRTLAPGALYTTAFRISEFTFDPDFLENHDAASKLSMPIYVQNHGGVNESEYATGPGGLDGCGAGMEKLCPGMRGDSFACMKCADAHRPAVEKACGKWSDEDDASAGFAVHWFCGVGWPESSFQRSPITEYCVEHLPAPQTDPIPGGEGFAQYISCNSDECDGASFPEGGAHGNPSALYLPSLS